MAANDYYNNTFSPNPSHHRTDAPLPPVPANNQSTQSISPVTSPFDDNHRYDYPSSHTNLAQSAAPMGYNDTSYHGAASQGHSAPYGSHGAGDPFADGNAIPLQSQAKLDGSPTRYQADPEGRGYQQPYYQQQYPGVHEKSRKKGWFSGRITWVVYILTIVQIGVFIGELAKAAILTKSPIQTKPQFNYMIGPSPYVLINMGARYQPCMHNIPGATDNVSLPWFCPNMTAATDFTCSLGQLCGFGGQNIPETGKISDDNEPNQWWRLIVPIFLHAGIIHIAFNMLLQLTLGRDMEKEIGSLRFALVYFAAGIFGNVLGANYAARNIPSVGASGALFGILALVMLDLFYNWNTHRSPVKDLLFLLLDIAIAFVLGLLPGLDNFAHIGGFIMGLALGICILHSPAALRERIGVDDPPYATVDTTPADDGKPALSKFVKQPVGFFKGRKPLWWVWWLLRAGALFAVFIGFILLLKNFYVWRNECSWCHRLSCLPIKDWCNPNKYNQFA